MCLNLLFHHILHLPRVQDWRELAGGSIMIVHLYQECCTSTNNFASCHVCVKLLIYSLTFSFADFFVALSTTEPDRG